MEKIGLSKIQPTEISANTIELLSKQWMLITAGNEHNLNTMTASWGGLGYLWNKPVAFVFVRPERYTFEFTERCDHFTLSFFDEQYRGALNICGKKSGRDSNKIAEAGITPCLTELGNPAFAEASLVLECKKLYGEGLSEGAFIDQSSLKAFYGQKGNLHKMYIAQIVNVWSK